MIGKVVVQIVSATEVGVHLGPGFEIKGILSGSGLGVLASYRQRTTLALLLRPLVGSRLKVVLERIRIGVQRQSLCKRVLRRAKVVLTRSGVVVDRVGVRVEFFIHSWVGL